MWCCGWWLIYVVDFWSLWWSSGLLVSSNSSILVAQVTTVQLVVEQWRLIVVRPGWPGTPTNSWNILLICVVHTVLACQVRRLGIIGVAFPDHWPHCVTIQHLIPVSFPDHWPHCVTSLVPRPSITANAVEGLVKLLRRMTSGGHLETWLIALCMRCTRTAVHRKCHTSRRPPDVILRRSFTSVTCDWRPGNEATVLQYILFQSHSQTSV